MRSARAKCVLQDCNQASICCKSTRSRAARTLAAPRCATQQHPVDCRTAVNVSVNVNVNVDANANLNVRRCSSRRNLHSRDPGSHLSLNWL